jgi:hypothetical protein
MSMKEHGQMAYEVFCSREGMACAPWSSLFHSSKELWAAVESAIRADEAAKVRAEAIEEAAKVAKTAWLTCPYGEIADADAMCALSEHTETAIRALAEK